MKNTIHTLLFAAVLGVVCSVLLVGISLFTAPFRLANQKAEQVRNYLAALEVPVAANAQTRELLNLFEQDIRLVKRGDLDIFEYQPAGAARPTAAAVAFSGPGVWGAIEGVLALEADMVTIRGIRFFRQEETPGLGGEIASAAFQEQFRGRRIAGRNGSHGFQVRRPGTVTDDNVVDAITGATMTSERVEKMLDTLAKRLGQPNQQSLSPHAGMTLP